jgi:hypothetical protein
MCRCVEWGRYAKSDEKDVFQPGSNATAAVFLFPDREILGNSSAIACKNNESQYKERAKYGNSRHWDPLLSMGIFQGGIARHIHIEIRTVKYEMVN